MRLRKDGQRDRRYLSEERAARFIARMPIIEAIIERRFEINALRVAIADGKIKIHIFQCTNCRRITKAPRPRPGTQTFCKVCGHIMSEATQ